MEEETVSAMLRQHFEFRDDQIARESIHVTEGWEPPEWRAQWRAAP